MKPEDTIEFPIPQGVEPHRADLQQRGRQVRWQHGHRAHPPEHRSGGHPSTKLGPKMGMESRSLVRTLQTMEEAGLIRREACTNDKRVVRIHLTDKGRQMRNVSRDTVVKFNRAVQGASPTSNWTTSGR